MDQHHPRGGKEDGALAVSATMWWQHKCLLGRLGARSLHVIPKVTLRKGS